MLGFYGELILFCAGNAEYRRGRTTHLAMLFLIPDFQVPEGP